MGSDDRGPCSPADPVHALKEAWVAPTTGEGSGDSSMDRPSPPPLTPFRGTVKYISIDDMDEPTRAFFAEHFFDFTGLETSGPASETLDTHFRTESPDGLHDHEPQPRRFSTGMG